MWFTIRSKGRILRDDYLPSRRYKPYKRDPPKFRVLFFKAINGRFTRIPISIVKRLRVRVICNAGLIKTFRTFEFNVLHIWDDQD